MTMVKEAFLAHIIKYHAWSGECDEYPLCKVQEAVDAEVERVKSWDKLMARLHRSSERK